MKNQKYINGIHITMYESQLNEPNYNKYEKKIKNIYYILIELYR
jgi:hypothetical protein